MRAVEFSFQHSHAVRAVEEECRLGEPPATLLASCLNPGQLPLEESMLSVLEVLVWD